MNKTITLYICLLLFCVSIGAQEINNTPNETNEQQERLYNKYVNFSFVKSSIEQGKFPILKNFGGGGFSFGNTFYLHKQRIAKCFRFGIDVTWFDLNYSNYKIEHITYNGTDKYEYHQGSISLHIGPSLTINPVNGFNICGYFRYAPTYSGLYNNKKVRGNYASIWIGGASISYKIIGLGIEYRFGNTKYEQFSFFQNSENTEKKKTRLKECRAYICFKF